MSKRRREAMATPSVAKEQTDGAAELSTTGKREWWRSLSATQRWMAIAILAFLSMGVLGAGLKYLEDSAREEKANQPQNFLAKPSDSLLSRLNPFTPAPTPTPTPQL